MAKENETIAEIIAEMKRRRHDVWISEFRSYADKLEAARKRERGNSAALREAIDYLCERMADMDATFDPSEVECLRAALAAPPRNCDMYANHSDAMKAFEAFVRKQCKLGFINPYTEAFKWLYDPATEKEGGAK